MGGAGKMGMKIRSSRGEDIFAACGMLSTAKQEENNKS